MSSMTGEDTALRLKIARHSGSRAVLLTSPLFFIIPCNNNQTTTEMCQLTTHLVLVALQHTATELS